MAKLTHPVTSVLLVCMGNICRSPTAEAVFRAKAEQYGLELEIDSAGTIAYHAGEKPDPRSQEAGERRGYDFSGMRARAITTVDLERFDLILAADQQNLRDIRALAQPHQQDKVALILDWGTGAEREVPDPYYGGERGFELVLDLLEDAAEPLMEAIRRQR
ncbi:low molecular weight protein-tyrosine-phosphatase [Ferrimonas marina]|uniref:Protein-tyrosine phosphatase n=1 Tax=Ferrimonas marina TaxID=299255 RepID=A0A1M5R9X1_9GAMM|nr:low molecular weight protein-tyrosine-phosphatase [Ferrimonas marina]SHH22613.1 protein-tyrosine phosphatase [Ferrimonas marina]